MPTGFPFGSGDRLAGMLRQKNGFYAFGSALHVLGTEGHGPEIGVFDWNSTGLWKADYEDLPDLFFFAEELFGNQYYLSAEGVGYFDSETSECELLAEDLEGWAACLLEDVDFRTGQELAREWELSNGAIPPGFRLLPKTPFVLGGEFELANLALRRSVEGMKWKAYLSNQIKNCPDGMEIEFKVMD